MRQRNAHRIAVAFGGRDEVEMKSGDFSKGFVQGMTEPNFLEAQREPVTINDAPEYPVLALDAPRQQE